MDDADQAQLIIEMDKKSMISNSKNSLIQNNETGICIECDGHIPAARLNIMPGCLRCFDCQNSNEGGK